MNANKSLGCLLIAILFIAAILHAEELVPGKKILLDQKKEPLTNLRIASLDKDGNIYVINHYPHLLLKYDKSGNFLKKIAGEGGGPGEIKFVTYIAVDDINSRLILADYNKQTIQVFDKDGKFIKQHTLAGNCYIAYVNKYGETYIVQMPSNAGPVISKLDQDFKETGKFFESSGKGNFKNFVLKHFLLDSDSSANIYAAEGLIYKINIYDRNGKFLRDFGAPGKDFRPFKDNPPDDAQSPEFEKWGQSFDVLSSLHILDDMYCVVFYRAAMKHDAVFQYDIYSLEGKKLGHGSLPAGVRPLAGRDSNGKLYCSGEEISEDGTDAKFRLIEYSVR